MKKIVMIDGNSILYRAFFALPLLSNSAGVHTNAVYGFVTMLLKLLEDEKPTHCFVAFDAGKETFRHKEYKEYKGGRQKTPPELSEQFPIMKEVLQAFGIQQFEHLGYEADDILGTVSRLAEKEGMEVAVVSGDKDLLQLASDQVTVLLTRKGISEVERYNPEKIHEKYELTPQQIIDLKGLMGDTSDNIPGIPGVGEKTALKLLHQYPSVEQVLEHIDEMKGKLQEKVRDNADQARVSKKLATIFREVPMDTEWNKIQYTGYESERLAGLFQRLEFKSLLDRMELSGQAVESEQKAMAWHTVTEDLIDEAAGSLTSAASFFVQSIGDSPHTPGMEVLGLSFCAETQVYFVPMGILQSEKGKPFRDWLADSSVKKATFDAHRTKAALHWKDIALEGVRFDILLAAYLVDPTESALTISGLCMKYGVSAVLEDEQIFGKGAKFSIPELPLFSEHCCRKAAAVQDLVPVLENKLEAAEMHGLFYDLELPLAGVLTNMETTGIHVDVEALQQFGEDLQQSIADLEAGIHELAGMEFNINSPKQLGEVLFEKLGLKPLKKTKTGYSTSADVLEKLKKDHEIIPSILSYRQLTKLQSTYVDGLLKEVNPNTGCVHTYYQQTIAATGRLSSQYPNLQNIPIRLEEGRKIRKVFTSSRPEWYILAADYSQIELRVLAHISQDERLMDAFRNNMDIHTKTAMDVFGVSEDQVDSNMRRQAKAVNFGIVYGISDYGLSQNLNIPRKDAKAFIDQYFDIFQGVRKYMDDIVMHAKKEGFVSTLLHRRRYLPEISASNFNVRSFAERTAMNTPIQGTAADIIKLAMVQMAERLQQENVQSRMLLQVHDELIFEVPEEELEQMQGLVPEVMEHALDLDVPLRVDVSFGHNWYEAK